LSLDADKVLTDELILELEGLSLDGGDAGYRVARKLFVADQFIRWRGYYPDYQLRLFQKSLGGFSELPVHGSVNLPVGSRIRNLKNPLNHYSYDSFEQMDAAFTNFARLSTKKRNKILNPVRGSLNFVYTFLNKFVFRLGFLHGRRGCDWVGCTPRTHSSSTFTECESRAVTCSPAVVYRVGGLRHG